MTTTQHDQAARRESVEYKGIIIRTYDVPCTPFVWVHDEFDGHGHAETIDEAKAQIDAHLKIVAQAAEVDDDA